MNSDDFSAIPPFLLQKADTDHIPHDTAGMPDVISPEDDVADVREAIAPVASAPAPHETTEPGEIADKAISEIAQASAAIELSDCSPFEPSPSAALDGGPVSLIGFIAGGGYSTADLLLFRTVTGYRLDTTSAIRRAVDDSGQRVPIADRLKTTLAEEAFRIADRNRRSAASPKSAAEQVRPERGDLTIDDLVMTLPMIRRAAASIGARGLSAFEQLEQAVMRRKDEAMSEALSSFAEQSFPSGTSAASGSGMAAIRLFA